MKARAYLGQLNKHDMVVRNLTAEIARWESVATDCTVHMDGERVQSCGGKQKMASAVENYVDLKAELEETRRKAERERRKILDTISLLPANQYAVVHAIYARGLQLKQVEAEMQKSHTWVCETHRKALANLQTILDQRKG